MTAIANALIVAGRQFLETESEIVAAHVAEPEASANEQVRYNGVLMSRQDAITLMDTKSAITHGTAYYSVLDQIDECGNEHVKALMLNSLDWAISAQVINAATNAFFKAFENMPRTDSAVDDFNEHIARMSELKSNGEYAEQLGFEENADNVSKLKLLLGLKRQVEDAAAIAHKACGLRYGGGANLRDMVFNKDVRDVSEDVTANIGALAEAVCEDATEDVGIVRQALLDKAKADNKLAAERRVLRAPAIMAIIENADYSLDVQFHQLPVDTQRALIMSTSRGATKAMATGAKLLNTIDYALFLPKCMKLSKVLKATLELPKFAA